MDRTAGGPAITHVKNREFLFDHTSIDGTKYDSRRRSIYLPVVRNNLYDVFQLFDTTDATVTKGDRATTTVATQALFYMNSELVADCAKSLASRLKSIPDPAGQIEGLYRIALGRAPSVKESERAIAALRAFEQDGVVTGLALVCQALLSSNEFAYIE